MRVLRWMVLVAGMLGGVFGLGVSAQAAPLPVAAGLVDHVRQPPAVQQAGWYFVRRHYYRPRYYRRYYYRPRYYYRRRFYRPYYYRPRYYRRRFFYY